MIDIKFMIDIVYDILIKMTLWVLIGSIPIVFMALIVVIVKKTNFGIKTRKVITIIYQILIKMHNYLLAFIFLVLFSYIILDVLKILILVICNVCFMFGKNLIDVQIKFLLLTMSIVLFYPGSVLLLKCYTIMSNDERFLFILIYNKTFGIIKKFPIEEIINILYVLLLSYSSIEKLGNANSSIDNNYIYLSFIIYIAVQATASTVYKKHASFFNRIDNRIFKTDLIKSKSKKMNIDYHLDTANKFVLEFIRTGKVSKESKKYMRKINKYFKNNSIDAIVTNPTYKKENTGIKNENKNQLISRYEVEANLEDFIKISAQLLKDKGEFYMVHRPDRIVDIIDILRKNKLEPKIIKLVYPKINKSPNLILIKAVKNAKQFLKFEEPLIIYDEDNNYTKQLLKIYNKEEE